jgi:hypothetical protein
MSNIPMVVSYGGGINSTALLVEFMKRDIRPDLITFSNTVGEKPETYAYIEMFKAFLVKNGMPTITPIQAISPTRGPLSLEADCLRLGVLPSKVYGRKNCSQRFKIEPQQKFLNHWDTAKVAWKQGNKVLQVIGYDAGERHRINKDYTSPKFDYWYPLVEWGWARDECKTAITSAGLPLPPKSACFFCPSSKKHEIMALKRDHPDLFARAVEMEKKAAPKLVNIKGLGRHWSWESLGAADDAQFKLIPENYMDTDCACIDGDEDE